MRRRPSKQRGLKDLVKRTYFQDAFTLFRVEAESTGRYDNVLKEWTELLEGRAGKRRPAGGRERQGEKKPRDEKERSRRRDDRDPGKRRRPLDKSKPPKRSEPARQTKRPAEEAAIERSVAENGPAIQPPQQSEEMEHGRDRRENRSWNGVAGQQSSIVMDMKKKIDSGELPPPSEEDIPYVKPGQSVSDALKDSSGSDREDDRSAAEDQVPDSEKWGRFKRTSD
jgi:hypothetical protein